MADFVISLQDSVDTSKVVELQIGNYILGAPGPKGDKGDTGDVTPEATAAKNDAQAAASAAANSATSAAASALDAGAAGTAAATALTTQVRNDLANNSEAVKGAGMVGFFQAGAGAAGRTALQKLRESVSVSDFGASGDGVTLNDSAFLSAEDVANRIYVPEGTFRLSTPMAFGQSKMYYGPGVLKFDNAEWWRRGGSSGSVAVPENYTLFYGYTDQSQVSVTFNGVSQSITWVDTNTVQVPGSLVTDEVKINVANGTIQLGPTPQYIRAYNMLGGAASLNPTKPDVVTTPTGYFNTSHGARALQNVHNGVNNTAVGALALLNTADNINQTAVGFQALYRSTGDGNTAVGSIAGEWMTTGAYNSLVGLSAGSKIKAGSYNVAAGYQALAEAQSVSYTVAIGHRAHGNSGEGNPQNSVAVGSFAGDFATGASNTLMGYRAGCGTAASDGIENVFVGFFAGRNQAGADYNVGVGVSALLAATSGQKNVAVGHSAGSAITTASGNTAIGYEALKLSTGSSLTAVGHQALVAATTATGNTAVGNLALSGNVSGADNTAVGEGALLAATTASNTAVGTRTLQGTGAGANNTAVGFEAARFTSDGGNSVAVGYRAGRALTTGGDNVAIGADALQNETTGTTNTAVGRRALRLKQDGTNQTGFSNATGLGFDAAVSGSNQVQLGNASTTTYVYGTVQNRSDARDKTAVRDTVLGLKFIEALRPVDFKWDMRDDYIKKDAEGNVTHLPKDGSMVRSRYHHGLIAQEVKDIIDTTGIDFGGYQDHAVNGGCDVMSLGYDELIAPLIKAVQELSAKVRLLESK